MDAVLRMMTVIVLDQVCSAPGLIVTIVNDSSGMTLMLSCRPI